MKIVLLLIGGCLFFAGCGNQVKENNDWIQFYSAEGQYKVMCPNKADYNKSKPTEMMCGDSLDLRYSIGFEDKESLADKSESEIQELYFKAQKETDEMFGKILRVEKINRNDMTFQEVVLNKTKSNLVGDAVKEFPAKNTVNLPQERIEQHRIIVKGKRVYDLRAYHFSQEAMSEDDLLLKNKELTDKFFNSFQFLNIE